MPTYRCYFLDGLGSIAEWQPVESSTDEEAKEIALQIFREKTHYPAIEVWRRDRRLLLQKRPI
jgi:hypothetical protein